MSTMDIDLIYNILIALAGAYVFLYVLMYMTQSGDEPPALATSLPFITTKLGLARDPSNFYVRLRRQHNLPSHTLRLPWNRIYVINSPSFIASVQRQGKALASYPPLGRTTANITGFDWLQDSDVRDTESRSSYWKGYDKAVYPPLAPGPQLDAMSRVMLQLLEKSLTKLREEDGVATPLYAWVKTQIMQITTGAVYGPNNPYDDPEVASAFWMLKEGITDMMRESYIINTRAEKHAKMAMNRGATAFEEYCRIKGHRQGSACAMERHWHAQDALYWRGQVSRSYFSNGVALLTNMVPNAFWMIYHVFSDAELLAECRKKIAARIHTSQNAAKNQTGTVDVSGLAAECPTLLAVHHEVLRFYSTAVSTRLVMEDCLLSMQYLLKKGATVVMPAAVQHRDPALWGEDCNSFNHRRFMSSKKCDPAALHAFGFGKSTCPGQHFATTESLAFTAGMIMYFDMTPKSGRWKQGLQIASEWWEATSSPAQDFDVQIRPRPVDGKGPKNLVFVLPETIMSVVSNDHGTQGYIRCSDFSSY